MNKDNEDFFDERKVNRTLSSFDKFLDFVTKHKFFSIIILVLIIIGAGRIVRYFHND